MYVYVVKLYFLKTIFNDSFATFNGAEYALNDSAGPPWPLGFNFGGVGGEHRAHLTIVRTKGH